MAQKYADRWEIIKSLSRGGQGETFLVRDIQNPTDDTKYVLKRLINPVRIARFRREVETTLKLNHPNILKLISNDLDGEKPFLVSEFCAGGTLRSFFMTEKPSLPEVFRLFLSIASGLHYAHETGVVHRDIKPDNIFLRLPLLEPVIGDFGLCYLVDSDERLTMTEEAVGPRLFVAPELEDGRLEDIAPTADVYSLGKLFYWMLSGGKMFSREKFREPNWDLKNIVPHPFEDGENSQMEHITRLLDQMIVAEPTARGSLKAIMSSAMRIQSLIHRGINPVSATIPQSCNFCGWGKYDVVVRNGNGVYNFGLSPVGNPNWKILACTECGHIQLFRLDHAKPDNWWAEDKRKI